MPLVHDDWVTEHFCAHEFDQPARYGLPGAPYPREWIVSRLLPLCRMLERLRTVLGDRHIRILSGYRTPPYNARIGGAPHSQHMAGTAADIVVQDLLPHDVFHEVERLLTLGDLQLVRGVGRYPGFTHLDIRRVPRVVWWDGVRTRT